MRTKVFKKLCFLALSRNILNLFTATTVLSEFHKLSVGINSTDASDYSTERIGA